MGLVNLDLDVLRLGAGECRQLGAGFCRALKVEADVDLRLRGLRPRLNVPNKLLEHRVELDRELRDLPQVVGVENLPFKGGGDVDHTVAGQGVQTRLGHRHAQKVHRNIGTAVRDTLILESVHLPVVVVNVQAERVITGQRVQVALRLLQAHELDANRRQTVARQRRKLRLRAGGRDLGIKARVAPATQLPKLTLSISIIKVRAEVDLGLRQRRDSPNLGPELIPIHHRGDTETQVLHRQGRPEPVKLTGIRLNLHMKIADTLLMLADSSVSSLLEIFKIGLYRD